MDVKNGMYRQRPFFQTGMPLFGAALLFLLPAICFCLRRNTFLLAVALLVIGLLLIMLGVGRIKGETKHILRFVQEKSDFYHKSSPDCSPTEQGISFIEYELKDGVFSEIQPPVSMPDDIKNIETYISTYAAWEGWKWYDIKHFQQKG